MKENKVIDLAEEKPSKFKEERETSKLRLENSKLQIELLQEKVKRLELQNQPINSVESREEPNTIKEEKVIDNQLGAKGIHIQEASLAPQVPILKVKEAPVSKKIKKNKGTLFKLSKFGISIGISALAFCLIYSYILRTWIGLIVKLSLPIGIIASIGVGIGSYIAFFREKPVLTLKDCPKCGAGLVKGKLQTKENKLEQLHKCLNPDCDYIDNVEFEV